MSSKSNLSEIYKIREASILFSYSHALHICMYAHELYFPMFRFYDPRAIFTIQVVVVQNNNCRKLYYHWSIPIRMLPRSHDLLCWTIYTTVVGPLVSSHNADIGNLNAKLVPFCAEKALTIIAHKIRYKLYKVKYC